MSKHMLDGQPWTPDFDSDAYDAEMLSERNNLKPGIHRAERDSLLVESDWTQMPDSPLSDSDKTLWQTYRTSLRNLPNHANWPDLADDDWPTKP